MVRVRAICGEAGDPTKELLLGQRISKHRGMVTDHLFLPEHCSTSVSVFIKGTRVYGLESESCVGCDNGYRLL